MMSDYVWIKIAWRFISGQSEKERPSLALCLAQVSLKHGGDTACVSYIILINRPTTDGVVSQLRHHTHHASVATLPYREIALGGPLCHLKSRGMLPLWNCRATPN